MSNNSLSFNIRNFITIRFEKLETFFLTIVYYIFYCMYELKNLTAIQGKFSQGLGGGLSLWYMTHGQVIPGGRGRLSFIYE